MSEIRTDDHACIGCPATKLEECQSCEYFDVDDPNYYDLAEKICAETEVMDIEMPYNWKAADVLIAAMTPSDNGGRGMTPDSVKAMCLKDGVITRILYTFGDSLMEQDWSGMLDDAIATVLEDEGL